jgi:hypothetical protein
MKFGGKSLEMSREYQKEWSKKNQKTIDYFNKIYLESLLSL